MARRRVRLALRAARESCGLTQGQVAEAMEWSLSKIMRIENGDVTISPIDLRALLACLEITDPAVIQRLVDDSKASRRRQSWWFDARYRDLPPGLRRLIQFESEATAVRLFSIMAVPGILQTPRYASAMLGNYAGTLSPDDIAVRHELRMRRQREFFGRGDSPRLMAMFDESLLRREVGGPEVFAEQLTELIRFADNANVLIRIVPETAAASIALLSPFIIVDLDGERNTMLYREGYFTDAIVDDPRDVTGYRTAFEDLWARALSDEDSLSAIEKRLKVLASGRRRSS